MNLQTHEQTDIDAIYNITMIKGILYDRQERQYYILANKHLERLGFFVIRVSEEDPSDYQFLIKWTNKLDIGDPNLYILKNEEKGHKELIVSYKSIFINTYNVMCLDISIMDEQLMIFRHESSQLWESEC